MNKKFKLNRIRPVLEKGIYNQFGIKVNINKQSYILLCITVFFLFFIYLSIPSLYNFDKLKPVLKKEIYNQFGLEMDINNINYYIFPSPRLKLINTEIYNFTEKREVLSSKNEIVIPINIFNLIGIDNIKFISFIINNISFNLNTSDIIKIKNLIINPKDKSRTNKLVVNSNIFNLDVNFIHEKSFNTSKESNLQIFIPKLGVQIKTNILDKNIKGNTIIKFPKNKIEFEHEFIDNIIKLNRSKINLEYFNGDIFGTISLDPFNFEINFDLENFYFSKLTSSQLIKAFKFNNILPINNKINGNLNFNIKNFKTKSNFISSGKIDLEFHNREINIDKFNLLIKDIGYIDIEGHFVKQKKKNHFLFDTKIKIQDQKLLFSRLTIPKKKRINKIDLNIKSLFDFNTNELIIKEFRNVNNFSDEFIFDLNKQINNFIFNKSINEIFNYFNLRLFINDIIK